MKTHFVDSDRAKWTAEISANGVRYRGPQYVRALCGADVGPVVDARDSVIPNCAACKRRHEAAPVEIANFFRKGLRV
jgi:hypothetical protein